ncbi:putative bifunctional diguanylate cyclase/phosphodiesterase [Pseudohaliea rubra]|uniref:Uncharacterized protein n=1 Tax=Pseudohaliea rubra DSM 19751 TaxID=1265313 RepID=A0A095VU86_9GAMM|nr:bifunctional diguanylate cyclase/phosphodiesterase [Pseudohaliea rubra]KGE04583.1 hypothetical protein HRUBRA_00742 [Pseudohaliea rubra DSM 19751]
MPQADQKEPTTAGEPAFTLSRLAAGAGVALLAAALGSLAAIRLSQHDGANTAGWLLPANASALLLTLSVAALFGAAWLNARARLLTLQSTLKTTLAERTAALEGALAEGAERERTLSELAFRDELTGLFSRQRIEQHYRELARSDDHQQPHGLVVINIRDFSDVNDSYGFATGDQLLKRVAGLLLGCCTPRDIVARFAADEFVVLMQWALSEADIAERLRQFRHALNGEVFLAGYALTLRTAIGAARFPDNGSHLDGLYQAARRAARRAGEKGGEAALLFDDRLDGVGEHRLENIETLRRAIADGSVSLHYQPIVELATMRISGAEGLARWQVDGDTLWSPARFLGLAVHSDQIHALNQRNLTQVIEQLEGWSNDPVFRTLYLSFNLSARDLLESDMYQQLLAFARAQPATARHLTVEIIESDVIDSLEPLASVTAGLRRAGMRVAIDDFGTGQSSLARLHELNVDLVKLDGSFIANLENNPKNRSLVHAVIDISHKLDARVIAEYVETPAQAALLRDMGCDYAQGNYFHGAMASTSFEALVAQLGGQPPRSMAAVPWPSRSPGR